MSCTATQHDQQNIVTRKWGNGHIVQTCKQCECTVVEPVAIKRTEVEKLPCDKENIYVHFYGDPKSTSRDGFILGDRGER